MAALQHKQDLEILITDSDGKNGHYLTVTGISWDTGDLTGFISYVDPRDGEDHTVDIASAVGEPLTIEYHDETRQIRVAVDESPVSAPEPGPASLILAGLAESSAEDYWDNAELTPGEPRGIPAAPLRRRRLPLRSYKG